jgi:hypothetical protein
VRSLAILLLLAAPVVAYAQVTPAMEADMLRAQGDGHAAAGEWKLAGDAYLEAAGKAGNPELLIEAAQAYTKGFEYKSAKSAYEAFLQKIPVGPRTDAIKATIVQLDTAIAAQAGIVKDTEQQKREDAEARKPQPRFEAAASLAPGVKLRGDNPFVLALRLEGAVRFKRRFNAGVFVEYARLSTSGSCGSDLPGPEPATDFDFGPRNQHSACSYLMPGAQAYFHLLPRNKIDPYVGLAPGFRIAFADYTTYWQGMKDSHSDTRLGFVLGARAGVTYHMSQEVKSWTVGGFVEAAYQVFGDREGPDPIATGSTSFLMIFVGGRSTVTF